MGKKAVGNFIDGHGICTKIPDLFLIVAHCGRGNHRPLSSGKSAWRSGRELDEVLSLHRQTVADFRLQELFKGGFSALGNSPIKAGTEASFALIGEIV
jgi:hypothetical protein